MKLKNISNYPKIVKGVRIEQDETEEVSLDAATAQKFRGSPKFEVVEEDDEPKEDTKETSKPEKNEEKEEGE